MIDVSQWRASIGLWNYCQAASSRPPNGRHSHSFKAAVDSKSGSTTSGEKTSKLPAALSLIAFLLLFHSLSLSRHILMIPPTGNCYQVQCTTGVTITDTNYLQSVVLPGGSSSNLIYNDLYLIVCLRMLLLLSGDVELNPGPILDDKPDISLLTQWLEPLVDWQSFGLLLPGITQQDITTIEDFETDTEQSKLGLFSKWLQKNPTATWRDVLNALTKIEEISLLQTINDQLQVHQCTGGNTDAPTSTVPVVSTVSSSVSVINKPVTSTTSDKELNMAAVTKIFESSATHYMLIGAGLNVNVSDLKLIPDTANSNLIIIFQRWFDANKDVNWDTLIKLCDDFPDQLGKAKSNLLAYIGQSIPDNVSSHTVLPSPVDGISNTPVTNIRGQSIPDNVSSHTVLPSPVEDIPGPDDGATQKEEIMFETEEDEKEVSSSLIKLKKAFASLMMKVRMAFDEKEASDPKLLINLRRWIETYMMWNDKLTNASLDETFKIIHPFYDFIDCSLIVDMSEEFLQDFKFSDDDKLNIVSELGDYKEKADKLRFSAQVKQLHKELKEIYKEHIPNRSKMPMISMKLHNPWHGSNINGLSLLIHNLLPVGHQQSIMKYITIISGSVIIKYSVYGSTADSLIEYTGGKEQFMRLIGIFSLYINGHPVLQEDENMNFTFEQALLEAVTAGNNEAVQFLLQLETVNIDHTNEEGKTALMIAIEHIYISITDMLLQANANPHLKTSDGSKVDTNVRNKDGATALMIASANGHYEVVKLLLEWEADPTIKSNNGNTALSLSKTSEIFELINSYMHKKGNVKLEEDDASTYSSGSQQREEPHLYCIAPDNSSTRSSPVSPETESIRHRTASDVSSTRSLSTPREKLLIRHRAASFSSAKSSSASDSERMESTRHQKASDTISSSGSERVESSGYGTESNISSTRNSPQPS
uniref:Death domain-containing protein n=1 Tax=Amphimedon queenslandica TaxID=400682 RepID=A0A1X7V060_AMPQE